MSSPYPTVNFSISADAWDEIDRLRAFWDGERADPAEVLMVGWGTTRLHDGRSFDHVIVSFYARSERAAIAEAIQRISGREVVFFILEDDHRRFAGRTIDFRPDVGFVLV